MEIDTLSAHLRYVKMKVQLTETEMRLKRAVAFIEAIRSESDDMLDSLLN